MSHYPMHDFVHPNTAYPSGMFGYPHYLPHDDMARPAFFSYSPDVIKHRKRTSRSQRKVLEEAFRDNPKPSQYTRKLLMHQTGMERRAIQVWFQNRRAKEKKLAAKAASQNPDASPSKDDSRDDDEDNSDDEDEDHNSTEAPCSPVDTQGGPASASMNITAAAMGGCAPPQDDSGSAVAAGSQASSATGNGDGDGDPSTPAATPSASASTNSPRPSTNGAPTPPSLWRSSDASNAKNLAPPSYAMRRESAPAPLAGNFARPSPFLQTHLSVNPGDGVAIWDDGTPPSPLSATDDVVSLSARRGSLPSFGSGLEAGATTTVPLTTLPGLPTDPSIRRMSLERSRQRLASHPYAPQVAAANRAFGTLPVAPDMLVHSNSLRNPARPSLPHVTSAPSATCIPTPAQMTLSTHGSGVSSPWDTPPIVDSTGPTQGSYPSYVRPPRRHGSYHSGMYNAPHRPTALDVDGPLPAPNFSFGTATAPISEVDLNETGEDDETGTGASLSVGDLHRFGSFASVTSTGSSVTSAWYSDVPSQGFAGPGDMETHTTWQPDARRASCPAPFVYAFSGLQVANEGQIGLEGEHPLSGATEFGLALDGSKQRVDRCDQPISTNQSAPLSHDTQLPIKSQGGGVHPFNSETLSLYSDSFSQASGFHEEFAYPHMNGYHDSLPAHSNSAGTTYPFYQ